MILFKKSILPNVTNTVCDNGPLSVNFSAHDHVP